MFGLKHYMPWAKPEKMIGLSHEMTLECLLVKMIETEEGTLRD